MANEVTTTTQAPAYSIADISEMARVFTAGGLFGYKKPEEAMTLMLMAQSDGIHPAKAAQEYHIISGKPALKSQAMQSRFQAAGGTTKWIKRTDKVCTLHLSHPQGGELEVTWTIEMAQNAGLTKNQTWKSYPTAMLSARCISDGIRALYPACLNGMYAVEEVQDFSAVPLQQGEETVQEQIKAEPAPAPKKSKKIEKAVEVEVVETTEMNEKTKTFVSWMNALREPNKLNFDKAWGAYTDKYGCDFSMVEEENRAAVYTDMKKRISTMVAQEMMNEEN